MNKDDICREIVDKISDLSYSKLHEIHEMLIYKKYISGITKISVYTKDNQKIILLYDIHHNKDTCKNLNYDDKTYESVSTWLLNLIKTKRRPFIDLFLEYRISSSKFSFDDKLKFIVTSTSVNHDLSIINFNLKNCLNLDLDVKCIYDNIRVHWADIRLNFDLYIITYRLSKSGILTKKQKELVNSLIDNPFDYYNRLLSVRKIKKQIENIDQVTYNHINTFYHDYIGKLRTTYIESRMRRLDKFMYVSYLNNLPMDLYLTLRLFRSFKTHISTKNHPNEINTAIIYAGGHHCRVYENLLLQLKFRELFISGDFIEETTDSFSDILTGKNIKSSQCVDIGSINMLNEIIL